MIRSRNEPLDIIRMDVIANPSSLPPLIQTYSTVIERGAICIKTFVTGSVYRDMLRREVQHLPELCSCSRILSSARLRSVMSWTVPNI